MDRIVRYTGLLFVVVILFFKAAGCGDIAIRADIVTSYSCEYKTELSIDFEVPMGKSIHLIKPLYPGGTTRKLCFYHHPY